MTEVFKLFQKTLFIEVGMELLKVVLEGFQGVHTAHGLAGLQATLIGCVGKERPVEIAVTHLR